MDGEKFRTPQSSGFTHLSAGTEKNGATRQPVYMENGP